MTPQQQKTWLSSVTKKHDMPWVIERNVIKQAKKEAQRKWLLKNAFRLSQHARQQGWIFERKET